MIRDRRLPLVDAPFVHHPRSTSTMMWAVSASLAPAVAWAIRCFGPGAALPVAVSILAALCGEALVGALRRRFTLADGSAFLTGLLIGMAMPPTAPFYVPAASALFAVTIVKGVFGGLGENWMNPALAGIVFAQLNWPARMNEWIIPGRGGVAALSGATPLSLARSASAGGQASAPIDLIRQAGGGFSSIDASITDALNGSLFAALNAELPSGYVDLLLGNKPGALGELSCILILAASIFAISRRLIRAEIPASITLAFVSLTWVFGGLPYGSGFFAGDALFGMLTGSFLLVAFFMASDPVTSPKRFWTRIAYGIGIGSLTFVIRTFGVAAEGSAYAVILMNCAVPALDGAAEALRGRSALLRARRSEDGKEALA